MATASATRNEGKTSEKAETPKRERRAAPALHERMKNQHRCLAWQDQHR